jgi:hypothetical protein
MLGEEVALIELVKRGEHCSVGAGKRLLERWPARVESVFEGIRSATGCWARRALTRLLDDRLEETVTEFLLKDLVRGAHVAPRVDVARMLLRRGRPEGLELFIKEWATIASPREPPPSPDDRSHLTLEEVRTEARDAITEFLLSSGDLRAATIVAKGLSEQPACVRATVVQSLQSLASLDKGLGGLSQERRRVLETFENILGGLLSDTDLVIPGGTMQMGHLLGDRWITLNDPRICDMAWIVMAEMWPDVYVLDGLESDEKRDDGLATLRRVWQARREKR